MLPSVHLTVRDEIGDEIQRGQPANKGADAIAVSYDGLILRETGHVRIMSNLARRLIRLARSPQGRKLVNQAQAARRSPQARKLFAQAQRVAQDPKNRERLRRPQARARKAR